MSERVFKKYDADGSGNIEVYELWRALAEMGVQVSEEVAGRMLAVFDPVRGFALS
eukprot:SAG31_NODE_41823_length_274_cov_0.742857_1_plen_54_part_01